MLFVFRPTDIAKNTARLMCLPWKNDSISETTDYASLLTTGLTAATFNDGAVVMVLAATDARNEKESCTLAIISVMPKSVVKVKT